MSYQKGLIARRRAIFFCAITLACFVLGIMSMVSCGHTPEATDIDANIDSVNKIDRIYNQSQTLNSDCGLLREENRWLRSELIRLNQELVDANEAIYTLNRKLDAIFNPELAGE